MSSGDETSGVVSQDSEDIAIAQAGFLSVMANRHRLHILFLLSESERSVGDLMRELRETPVAVSRHLTILRENNIIRARRCGKIVRYSLICERAVQMIKVVDEICCSESRDVEDETVARSHGSDMTALSANLKRPPE